MHLPPYARPRYRRLCIGACILLISGLAAAAEITVPRGFAATVFHVGVGTGARHITVRESGEVFVSRRSGELVALKDGDGDGRADEVERRRLPITTGVATWKGFLYVADDESIHRLLLDDELMPAGDPERIVGGFPRQGSHATKSIALNDRGDLFVNVGAPSNACQAKTRSPGSPGLEPCPQLERQAAIWRFSADRADQDQQRDGERYVTGTRNVVAMTWHATDQALYFVMHGRDQLSTLWPALFDDEDSAEMPAEEFHRAVPGANYGWPSTFVDPRSGRRLVAPEYGGDGSRVAEPGRFQTPLHNYPAHWAPNALLFYTAEAFPARYRGGVFIAWRGSWNRAPLPQQGYRVTFQPFANGAVTGPPEDFVLGFTGTDLLKRPSDASWRPGGLAVGPDGALYVVEEVEGRIWRITWAG